MFLDLEVLLNFSHRKEYVDKNLGLYPSRHLSTVWKLVSKRHLPHAGYRATNVCSIPSRFNCKQNPARDLFKVGPIPMAV